MKSVLIACPMMLFTLAAMAQLPSVPKLPTESAPPMAVPTVPALPSSGTSPMAAPSTPSLPTGSTPSMATPTVTPPGGTSMPGTGDATNAIGQAKTEAECKIPTNATKPGCVKLMPTK